VERHGQKTNIGGDPSAAISEPSIRSRLSQVCRCAGALSVFTQMSHAFHGFISQPVFRFGSGVFEIVVTVLLLISKTARVGVGLTIVWMTVVILSHIFVLGYDGFFVDALAMTVLAIGYLLLTRGQSVRFEQDKS